MNILFHKMRTGKKGQIIAVLTVALIIFIIATFLVVNFGKNKIQDTRIRNAAQAGVLAGGSAASVLLNSMANVNDNMIMNFAGFTVQIQLMLVSWLIDYVKTVIKIALTLTPFNYGSGLQASLAVGTLILTTASLAIMITGATKIGNALYKMIDELNTSLPKNSRDSARQYAFSNAGVDAPKIPFSRSGAADALGYSLVETKFDEFMRLLPAENKADTNYGTSVIEFDWNDSRTEHIVNNKVAVTVTPVQKVPFRLIRYRDIGPLSGAINAYLSTVDLGFFGFLIKFGVNNAGVILALLVTVAGLIVALAVYAAVIAVVLYVLAAVCYAICAACSWLFCACCAACVLGAYYTGAAIGVTVAFGLALGASIAFLIFYSNYPPGGIPCFVWDQNNPSNSYPLSVTVNRTTSPSSINYGIYTTDWPAQSRAASGIVTEGSIFPPKPKFDILPNF